jgi:RNA polymerase sigma-70 factor (ECF subfamily)
MLTTFESHAQTPSRVVREIGEVSGRDDGPDRFDALLEPHLARLFRLAYRLSGDGADAEDLVQEVLIKAYGRRDDLAGIEALGPWLGRVLYNRFIDESRGHQRKRMRTVSLDAGPGAPEPVSSEPEPDAAADAELDIKRLHTALAALSLDHRTVLLMHDSEGYKLEEIQKITSVPVGTLKSRLHRARARLRNLLDTDGTL